MTNKEFTLFCKSALAKNTWYMWGEWGRPITTSTITSKAKQYPEHYTAAYQNELAAQISKGGIGCDCTGLIKWYLWTGGDIETMPKYSASTDRSASGWYRVAGVRGLIATMPEREGLILSFPGHCGVYIGDGQVIECTRGRFGNGVVQTKINDRKWKQWCECRYIEYIEDTKHTEIVLVPARVKKDCPAYATANCKQVIGTIYKEDSIRYIGDYNAKLAIVLYPTAATVKIAFADRNNIIKE